MISRRCWLGQISFVLGGCAASGWSSTLEAASQTAPAGKFDWPQFLGPRRNGISAETGLLDKWPTGGPREVWRKPGGVGMSGLAISRGRVITMIERGGQQQVAALSADQGTEQWLCPIAPAYKNQMGNGTRATPTIAGERVFVFSGEGILAAVNLADGKLLWSKNLLSELNTPQADYGMACSPLVVDDQVIVSVGATNGSVAAFDVGSGKLIWKTGSDPAGYSSPTVLSIGGREQIVAFTGGAVMGLATGSGASLWRFPYETDFGCNIASPIAWKDKVFVSSGENHGCVLLDLKKTSDGLEASEVWSSQGPKSVLRNEWQTAILLDNHLYGFDNVGGAGPISHLTCISAETGQVAWQQPRFGKGNMIAADGKLLISTMKGEFIIARASPKAYEEIGRATVLSGATRQAPSLANGLLYLRDDKEIVCLKVKN
ncbi:PQQ-binding-like beta-propeller repeat protein [Anatilimnocola floriformis]|uniref:PQQ-binding-like beta-propeller repeat protein n=1 Tax=Anatilimnocola floriformis TaxID=2948575 RepID=UPI0020C4F767|nr:PQQ-binding-like beta-propeller repeat protein [Anatilimnocola floriformis]